MPAFLMMSLLLTLTACDPRANGHEQFETTPERSNIVGGQLVESNSLESSFVVMIYGETELGKTFICTGTFISNSLVLTAAHCVTDDVSKLTLAFSVNPFNDADVVTLPVTSVLKHEKYLEGTSVRSLRNDIALIRFSGGLPARAQAARLPVRDLVTSLSRPFSQAPTSSSLVFEKTDTKPTVVPELPSLDKLSLRPFAITNLLAMGYGRTEGNEDSETASAEIGILRSVRINFDKDPDNFQLESNNFTASQRGQKGVCSGDSGGPIMDTESKQYTVIAISSGIFTRENVAPLASVSVGAAASPSAIPSTDSTPIATPIVSTEEKDPCMQDAVFMNVRFYLSWIRKNLG